MRKVRLDLSDVKGGGAQTYERNYRSGDGTVVSQLPFMTFCTCRHKACMIVNPLLCTSVLRQSLNIINWIISPCQRMLTSRSGSLSFVGLLCNDTYVLDAAFYSCCPQACCITLFIQIPLNPFTCQVSLYTRKSPGLIEMLAGHLLLDYYCQ
jgi:hypothetical protein